MSACSLSLVKRFKKIKVVDIISMKLQRDSGGAIYLPAANPLVSQFLQVQALVC